MPKFAKREISIFSLFFVFVVTYIFNINNWTIFSTDEALYLTLALNLNQYGSYMTSTWTPYTYRGPVFPIFVGLGMGLSGISLYSGWIVSKFFSILFVLSSFLIGKLLFNKRVGFIVSIFILTTPEMIWAHSNRVLTDIPLTLFFFVNSAIYYIGFMKKDRSVIFLGGMMSGTSFLLKEPGILSFILFITLILFFKNRVGNTRLLLSSIYGLSIPLLLWGYYIYTVGGIFGIIDPGRERVISFGILFLILITVLSSKGS